MIALLTFFLTDEQMASFGWRIPFLLGLFLGLFGLYLRRSLKNHQFSKMMLQHNQKEITLTFTNHQILLQRYICVFCAVVFFNVTNYMVTAYLPTYLEQVIKLDATTTSVLITCVMAIMIPLALMFGKLADKIGEKKVFLIGTGGLTLFSIIAFMLLHSQSFVVIVIGIFY